MSEADSPQHQTPAAADLRAAYDAGFADSGEGWNGEYPGQFSDAEQKHYEAVKTESLSRLSASPPQPETPGLDREAVARIINPVAFRLGVPDYYGPDLSIGMYAAAQRDALAKADAILAATAVSQPPTSDDEDWRDDPSADERWNAGLDYGLEQLCAWLDVDRDDVCWDAATETLDGDVQAVIGNILRRKFGDDFDFKAVIPVNVVDPAQPPTSRQGAGEVEAPDDTKLRHRIIRIMLDEIAGDEERAPVPVYGIDEAAEKIMAAIGEAR